jgi:hypothetical protein
MGSFFQIPLALGFEAQNRHPPARPLQIGFVFSPPVRSAPASTLQWLFPCV